MGRGRPSGFIGCGCDWMIRGLGNWMIWEEEERSTISGTISDNDGSNRPPLSSTLSSTRRKEED